jgi:hypothetical protein
VVKSGEKGFEPLTFGFGDHCSTIGTIPLSPRYASPVRASSTVDVQTGRLLRTLYRPHVARVVNASPDRNAPSIRPTDRNPAKPGEDTKKAPFLVPSRRLLD